MLVVWLTALWVSAVGRPDGAVPRRPASLIALFVVVIAWPTGTRFTSSTSFHPIAALRYLVYFAGQLVVSNLVVAARSSRRVVAQPGDRGGPDAHLLGRDQHARRQLRHAHARHDHRRRAGPNRGRPAMPTLYIHVSHFVDPESARRRRVPALERYAVAAFGDRS